MKENDELLDIFFTVLLSEIKAFELPEILEVLSFVIIILGHPINLIPVPSVDEIEEPFFNSISIVPLKFSILIPASSEPGEPEALIWPLSRMIFILPV